jgi:hypothetical protein
MLVLSPVYHSLLPKYRARFGYIQNIHAGGTREAIYAGYKWLLDNNAYTGRFDYEKWIDLLQQYESYAATCVGVVIPDVVGNAAATTAQWDYYSHMAGAYGYPVAYVTQDGLEDSMVPWDELDVLFIGGTDQHKLKESWPFIEKAKELGIWVHVGRVNSLKRAESFYMADSVDGTLLKLNCTAYMQRLHLRMMDLAKAKKAMERLL